MTVVIDTIKSPPVDALRAAGVTGVSRYLYWNDSRDTLGKVIEKPEFDWLHTNGFDVMLNWEGSARDWLGGAAAAKIHATEAVRQARALGYPAGCTIYGSVDFDMTLAEWNSAGRPYGQTYSSVTRDGGYVAGVYGPWDVLGWCQQLGGGVFGGFWQTMSTAWSAGRNAQLWPGAHLRQRHQQTIGGQDCDVNDIVQADYGQYRGGSDMAQLTDKQTENLLAAIDIIGAAALGWEQTWDKKPIEFMKTLHSMSALLTGTIVPQLAAALAAHPAPGTGTDPAAIEQALRDVLPTIRLSAG